LQAGVKQNTKRRFLRAEAMVEDFLKHGIDLKQEVDSLLYDAAPTRPHFAQALVNLAYAKNKQQAFKRYLVPGKPGYVAMQWPELDEIGEWITGAGGIAVLAHPMRYKFTRTKLVRLIEQMIPAGVSAIEVSTSTTDTAQTEMLAELTRQHQLLASTGSDFHSLDQPWARLGGAKPLPENVIPVWTEFTL
jgi:predicted metal-dependent phosphoesterase TrpH